MKVAPAKAAMFAGVYLLFGILVLGFMTVAYGRPPLTALIPVVVIPGAAFAFVLLNGRSK